MIEPCIAGLILLLCAASAWDSTCRIKAKSKVDTLIALRERKL